MVSAAVREKVTKRADSRCEYCQLSAHRSPLARMQIEHIIATKHGGTDDLSNLALACADCNMHKGPNLAGIDPHTGALTELFNPRQDPWDEHFRWVGIYVVGMTAIGRTTIRVLNMNSEDQVSLRKALS